MKPLPLQRWLHPILLLGCLLGIKNLIEPQVRLINLKSLDLPPLLASYHSRSVQRYSLGFQHLISGLMWIKLLQTAKWEPLKDGNVSWEFAQLDAITTLDPHFSYPYSLGAGLLSVLRRDNLGAKIVLEKWVKRRPIYWRANYLLGHHLFFEMGKYSEASKYVLYAATLEGAPPYLTALGIRLVGETGQLLPALSLSIELWNSLAGKDAVAKTRLARRIRALRYALEKAAWEKSLQSYRAKWKAEPSDISALGPFIRDEQRTLASVIPLTEIADDLAPLLRENFSFRYDRIGRRIVSEKMPEALDIDIVGIHRPKQ